MKKKVIGVALMAAIAVMAGWNIVEAFEQTIMTDIILGDVEAMAQNESGDNKGTMCFRGEFTGCSGESGMCRGKKC